MSDHSLFLEDWHESLAELPGFPYLRVEPILLLGNIEDVKELWESPQEELIFSLHGKKGRLLVVTNHRISVYRIPKPKGFIRRATGFIFDISPLGPLSDAMEVIGAVQDVSGAAKSITSWLSPKQRRQRSANKDAGMPNPKDIKDTTWKTKDLEILALINLYRERILIDNAFEWKTVNQLYWRTDGWGFPQIHIEENNITLTLMDVNGDIAEERFETSTIFGLPEIVEYIIEKNLMLLHDNGWSVRNDEGVVLQNMVFFETRNLELPPRLLCNPDYDPDSWR